MVVRPDGSKYEPSIWDIDDSEKSPDEIVGNWLCMGIATLLVFPLTLFIRRRNVQVDSSPTKPPLCGV